MNRLYILIYNPKYNYPRSLNDSSCTDIYVLLICIILNSSILVSILLEYCICNNYSYVYMNCEGIFLVFIFNNHISETFIHSCRRFLFFHI